MPRITLNQMAQGRLPTVLGLCQGDLPSLAQAINAAQERLIFAVESGDEGWYGTWAQMAFNVLCADPYVTLGRWGSRLMEAAVCTKPVSIFNEFQEYLEFGNGLLPQRDCSGQSDPCGLGGVFSRLDYPTFRDLTPGHLLRIRALDPLDSSGTKRVLVAGTDSFGNIIYSQVGGTKITGIYLNLVAPFVDTPMTLSTLTGLQKDDTLNQVQFYDVDPLTGDEVLIL